MGTQFVGFPRELLPREYTVQTIGIHTRWLVQVGRLQTPSSSATSRALKRVQQYLPSPNSWANEAGVITNRLPLLWRFAYDLARENGRHFWMVMGGKMVMSFIPALELMAYTRILDIARSVPETGVFNHRALAIAFGFRLSLLLVSLFVDHLSDVSEKMINSRFATTIQSLILRIHCVLDDSALATPEVQSQIRLLNGLGGSSAYGQMFDPLGFLSVVNTALGVGLELGVLYFRVNHANRWLLALSVGFIALQNLDFTASSDVIEHVDTTHNGYLRLQNLFKLGTSPTFRREVNALNLHSFLLSESATLRHSLRDFQTIPLSTSPFSHPRFQLRSTGNITNRTFSLRSIILDLERPITYTLFTLISSSQHSSRKQVPLMVFGDVAILENATRNLHYRALALRGYVGDLGRSLESMQAYYEGLELEERHKRKTGAVYKTCERLLDTGKVSRGMKIEFVNVTLRYPGGGLPALRNVSFTVLPGEVVAIVGFNGSGKTSLISLLAGTERNYEGSILINDVEMKTYDPRTLAKLMSFAFQSSPVLPFSIREYVALGSVEHRHDEDLVKRALCSSGADEVAASLPDHWDTYPACSTATADLDPWASLEASWDLPRISPAPLPPPALRASSSDEADLAFSWLDDTTTAVESGRSSATEKGMDSSTNSVDTLVAEPSTREYSTKVDDQPAKISFPLHSPAPRMLSGGQWQRIALARAFFKPTTELLVLDEPGSSLDPAAEASIYESILARRGKSTVMFSTHRFGITAQADKVLFFDSGRLTEAGSHQELMAIEGGQYRLLWEVQARGFET